ncbi:MAG: DUF808 domain-containing protein [Planctomycetaceae bacterium]
MLLDDITSILDDVAVLTKVAAKKTAGVLGDDLALNAQQVSGVEANRELPVVFAVAKGSLVNKAILVPAALGLSAAAPSAITPLLILGGLYLCYEGCEKLAHKFLHSSAEDEAHHRELQAAVANPVVDLVAHEKEKVRGAIRTDFILSAEIIVITLGTVAANNFTTRVAVLVSIALLMTVGVYGLVAAIVKLDDLGTRLIRSHVEGTSRSLKQRIGYTILVLAPYLMKTLSIAGTIAMFLVGGGILAHGVPAIHHAVESILTPLAGSDGTSGVFAGIARLVLEGFVGLLGGTAVLVVVTAATAVYRKFNPKTPAAQA